MHIERPLAARLTYANSAGTSKHWFASIDGETWVEVSDDPRGVSVQNIQKCLGFENGKRVRYPMTMTRGFIRGMGGVFLTGEVHE